MAMTLYNSGWISPDGIWGVGDIILFDELGLTEKQWDTLNVLDGRDAFEYVEAIMAGEPLDEWENQ